MVPDAAMPVQPLCDASGGIAAFLVPLRERISVRLDEAPVVGLIGPRPDGLDAPYWDGLAAGKLRLQRCAACDEWIWGPLWMCPSCHQVDPAWVEVDPIGSVYAWTRTWQKFAPEFAAHVPYVTVLVELPHAGGRRILGLLLGDDMVDPSIGEAVEGVFQLPSPLTGGAAILRWQRPE